MWRSWPAKGQEKARPPAHGVGPPDGLRQPLLLLSLGPRVGSRRSSRPTRTPRGRSGSTSTVTSGPNASATRRASPTRPSTTGSGRARTPESSSGSATGWGPGAVKSFFWRWSHRLPSPFTRADLRHGYTYELAFRQFEVSDTRVFDRPQAGRAFFEGRDPRPPRRRPPRPGGDHLRPAGQLTQPPARFGPR